MNAKSLATDEVVARLFLSNGLGGQQIILQNELLRHPMLQKHHIINWQIGDYAF